MGIHGGGATLIDTIARRALYNRLATTYNIYIDGEFMRYKGINPETKSAADSDDAMVETALRYLGKVINAIKSYLPGRLKCCYAYMDGTRQEGKVQRVKGCLDDEFTRELKRARYIFGLKTMKCAVIELEHGEAELQMYIRRDKSVPLNVFVTNDSDMVPICYGHLPSLPVAAASFYGSLAPGDMPVKYLTVIDPSYAYPKGVADQVLDSCVWFKTCPDKLQVVGFDGALIGQKDGNTDDSSTTDEQNDDRTTDGQNDGQKAATGDDDSSSIGLMPRPLRCLVYFCGTDYSDHLLTATMVDKILLALEAQTEAGREARLTLNQLTDPLEMAAVYMFLAIRGGGTVRQMKVSSLDPDFHFDPDVVSEAFEMFHTYVTTGTMGGNGKIIPRPSGMLLSRELLYALYGQSVACSSIDRTNLLKLERLADVLEQFRANFRRSYWIDSLSPEVRDKIRAGQAAKRPPAVFSNLGPHMNNMTEFPAYRREFVVPTANENAYQAQSSSLRVPVNVSDSDSDQDDDIPPPISKRRRPNPYVLRENDTPPESPMPEIGSCSPDNTSPDTNSSDSARKSPQTGRFPDNQAETLTAERKFRVCRAILIAFSHVNPEPPNSLDSIFRPDRRRRSCSRIASARAHHRRGCGCFER